MHAFILPPLDVRVGQRLSLSALRDAAVKAVGDSRLTQEQVAGRLGVSQAAVGAALGRDYMNRAGTLVRIVEEFDPKHQLRTEKRVEYVVEKRAA